MTDRVRRERVLQVINALDVEQGGPPASAVSTALALQQEGLENAFAFVYQPGRRMAGRPYEHALVSAGIRTYAFPASSRFAALARRWSFSIAFAWWFLRHCRRWEIVHTHGAWTFTSLTVLVVGRATRRKVFLTAHESLTDFDRAKSPLHGRVVKAVLRSIYLRAFHRVIVASHLEQRDSGDRDGSRTAVVPHAVRIPQRIIRNREPRHEVVIGFLARLHPKKNLGVLIDALSMLDRRFVLHVAGDGPPAYRRLLEQRAWARGVADRMSWLGFVTGNARERFLEAIDVLAVPSAYECFGVATVEAMGHGVPVLVTPTVGVAHVVERFGCGVIVRPEAEVISRALTALVENGQTAAMSDAARRASRVFSIEEHGRRLRAVYDGHPCSAGAVPPDAPTPLAFRP